MDNEKKSFGDELKDLINRYNVENNSNTPDFVLSQYLVHCLAAYETAIHSRNKFYGRQESIFGTVHLKDEEESKDAQNG